MKLQHLITVLFVALLVSCGGKTEDTTKKSTSIKKTVKKQSVKKATKKDANTATIDLSNKGIGPVKSITLGDIDVAMVDNGKLIFKNKCSSCHRVNRKFIGPNPTGILEKRSPEWVMNMILNPEEMVKKDPVARQLLIEYNGSPMANQNLTEEEARAVLEYFRTLK